MAPRIVEAGSDGASVCLFDPAALPRSFDAKVGDGPPELMGALQAKQRFWFSDTGGDGRYIFHFYVDETPPRRLARAGARRRIRKKFSAFHCPSGVLWTCGSEYAAEDPLAGSAFTPEGGLARFPAMGGSIDVPAGVHRMTISAVEWPGADRPGMKLTVPQGFALALLIAGLCGVVLGIPFLLYCAAMLVWSGLTTGVVSDWHLSRLPIALALALGGAALMASVLAASRLAERRGGARAGTAAADRERLSYPDYIVEIRTGAADAAASPPGA